MFEDIEKRLQTLRSEEVSKQDKISEITENTETTTFEQVLRKRIKEEGIVEVFEKGDGTLEMHTAKIIDKWFFISLCLNAILFILLLTNSIGVW